MDTRGVGMTVLCHYNPGLYQQRRYAEAFSDAGCSTTPTRRGDADFHIVQGPHFALKEWSRHPNLILLDRAYWGDPDRVTLCWWNRGSPVYPSGDAEREKPQMLPWKTGRESCLVLADYKQDVSGLVKDARKRFGHVSVRLHPAEKPSTIPLRADLCLHHVCAGTTSTALVEAALLGTPVICDNPRSPAAPIASAFDDIRTPDRAEWLHELSWRVWSIDEIRDGSALDALMECHESRQAAA